MKPIVTLTLNPSVDASSSAETVHPTHKIRTSRVRHDPGGGGINVSRVIAELGGATRALYFSGGATGALLDGLLAALPFAAEPIPMAGPVRISHTVQERATGLEYRFTPEGPEVSAAEWRTVLAAVSALDFDYLVASGSLPGGLAKTCYRELAALAAARGARFVLDTSGPVLRRTVEAGGVHLAKPSLGELRALTGAALHSAEEIEAAALALTSGGGLDMVAVTLGHDGAMLAGGGLVTWLRPPEVKVASAVGAGDSFLGGMLFGLARGDAPEEAFALGVAAGSAAVITPGTELCRRADIERLLAEIRADARPARPEAYVLAG